MQECQGLGDTDIDVSLVILTLISNSSVKCEALVPFCWHHTVADVMVV